MDIVSTNLSRLLYSQISQTLLLPEIQRDFVWTKHKIIALLDSLYHGFPIGAMLIWKTSMMIPKKPYKEISKQKTNLNPVGELIYGYLLDGQQRLTALLMVLNEELIVRFHLINENFEIDKKKNRNNPLYISVADALNDKIEIFKVLSELHSKKIIPPENQNKITNNYLKLTQLLNNTVAVLEYSSQSYKDATELFIRFNSGGVKLTPAELAIAELASSAPSLINKEIREFSKKWYSKGFAFTIPFLVGNPGTVYLIQ